MGLSGKLKRTLPVVMALTAGLMLAGCQQQNSAARAELGVVKEDAAELTREDVATTTAVKISFPETILLTGSLAADEHSEVAAKRGGVVEKVLVDRGSLVKMGDVLVQLDMTDARNTLAQTEAAAAELMVRLGLSSATEEFDPQKQPDVRVARTALELAQSNHDRDRKLFESKVISPEEYDQTRNVFITARQQYELAVAQASQLYQQFQTALTRVKTERQFLEDMAVRAPFDGAVVEKAVSPGEHVMGGSRAAVLVRTDPLRLVLNVPEQAVGQIAPDQTVRFTVDAFPGQTFEGTVKNISPVLDDTRTLAVEALVDNPEQVLKPGLFATAQLHLGSDRDGVRVPASALRKRDDVAQVFVVDEGIARATLVVPGETRQGYVEIKAGLKGGELVVSNALEVEDGIRIR